MLFSAIPSYRLPREVIRKEIESLLDENITLKCGTTLGRDFTIDGLFADGYGSIFLAIGAHKSRRLHLRGEDLAGVYPSMQYLKAFNQRGEQLAKGRVGVIGGGNSAIDAARVAVRQPGVRQVIMFYRRTRDEMPAFAEEIEAALQEGIQLETLVSPIGILSESGKLSGIECINNELGPIDETGRRRPVAIPGTQHIVLLDTLIVAISEGSDIDCLTVAGANRVDVDDGKGVVQVTMDTLETNRPGVFAGGDVVTGPNTVVDAIAAGKKVAVMIDRYMRHQPLRQEAQRKTPTVYVEPVKGEEKGAETLTRIETPRLTRESRRKSFAEVEITLSAEDARREASRCLRCDLEFTRPLPDHTHAEVHEEFEA